MMTGDFTTDLTDLEVSKFEKKGVHIQYASCSKAVFL